MQADDPVAGEELIDGGRQRREVGALGELVGNRPQERAAIEVGGRCLQPRKSRVKVSVGDLVRLARGSRTPRARCAPSTDT
jgi:hypothetical protein